MVQGYGFWKMRHAVRLEQGLAVHRRRRAGRRDRHQCAALGQSGLHAGRDRDLPGALCGLRPDPARRIKPVQARHRRRHGSRLSSAALLGAMAGFPGIIIVIWCSMRGWPRDVQRGVFQPVSVALLGMSAIGLGCHGIDRAQHRVPVPDRTAGAGARHMGRASGCTARSTTRCSARSCCGCCWRRARSCSSACGDAIVALAGPAAVAPRFPRLRPKHRLLCTGGGYAFG